MIAILVHIEIEGFAQREPRLILNVLLREIILVDGFLQVERMMIEIGETLLPRRLEKGQTGRSDVVLVLAIEVERVEGASVKVNPEFIGIY